MKSWSPEDDAELRRLYATPATALGSLVAGGVVEAVRCDRRTVYITRQGGLFE